MDSSGWNALKGEIKRLYINENKKLADVMQILQTTRGFRKTRRQYERKLKTWKFEKYKMTSDKWKIVRKKVEKRRRQDKKSEVYINGVRCPSPKVRREMSRTFESALERAISAPSPTTPEGIFICSPLSFYVEPIGPPRLPWQVFQQAFMAKRSQGRMTANPISFWSMPPQSVIPTNIRNTSTLHCLVSWLGDTATSTTSPATTVIRLLMPDSVDNEQPLPTDQALARQSEPHMHKYHIFLYLLSNKFIQLGNLRRKGVSHIVLKLLQEACIDTAEGVKGLFSANGIAAEAMTEGLFGATVRFHDFTAMRILLDAGVNPDAHIEGGLKALELAAAIHNNALSLEITRLLISYGSGVNRQKVLDSALIIAGRGRKFDVCKTLLSAGARVTPNSIRASIISYGPSAEPELVKLFINASDNIDEIFETEQGNLTLLGLAVELGNVVIAETLLESHADPKVVQKICFEGQACYTTVVGLAARKGLVKMVDFLVQSPLSAISSTRSNLVSPMALAISNGYKMTVDALLQAGINFDATEIIMGRSLIQRAMDTGDMELCETLLHSGQMTSIDTMVDFYSLKLMYSSQQCDIDTTLTLLDLGARVNDSHDGLPNTVLGASIEAGSFELIDLLLNSGAVATGCDLLTSIGNMETAIYLARRGILPPILFGSGQILLTTAILSWNLELVQYLLSHDVDRQDDQTIQWQKDLFYGVLARACRRKHKRYNGILKIISPLEAAITCGNYSLATLLLARGAAVTESLLNAAVWDALRTQNDRVLREILLTVPEGLHASTAVAMAAYTHDVALIELLCPRGIFNRQASPPLVSNQCVQQRDLNKPGWWHNTPPLKGQTVLLIPAVKGDRALLRLLLTSAAWTRTDIGRALTIALYFGKLELAQDLLETNLDVNQPLEIHATTLTPLCCAVKLQNSSLVQILITHGANVNPTIEASSFSTPLQRAVETNDSEIVRILIGAGADVIAPPPSIPGATALHIAVKEGNIQLIDILLDAGADIDANFGATALQYAAIMGYISIMYKLLVVGANINAPRARFYARTALEGAAEYGRIDMLQVLLNEGVHFTGELRLQYVRAVKLAESNGHFAAAKLLKLTGGWAKADSLQHDKEVFDREEVERFREEYPEKIKDLNRHGGSGQLSCREAHKKPGSDGRKLNGHFGTDGDRPSQTWRDCIDQIIDANGRHA